MNDKPARSLECPVCSKRLNPRKNAFCPACGYEIFTPIMDRYFNIRVFIALFAVITVLYLVFRLLAFDIYVYLDMV